MRLFVLFFMIFLVSACTAPRPGAHLYLYLDRADDAIDEQKWEVAYRFLEDGLISNQPDIRQHAIALTHQYPNVVAAGALTFSPESISKTLLEHGPARGIDLERKRLAMFKIVANSAAYEKAKSNIESAAVALDEKQRKDDHTKAEAERKKLQIRLDLLDAAKKSRFLCQSKAECEKAFSLTQIFVSEKSDMKIQVATNTIIDTYNPTDSMNTALKAIKIPQRGETAEIVLTAFCRDEGSESFKENCNKKLLSIYIAYPAFIQSALRQ